MNSPEEKAKELVEKFRKINEQTDVCFGDCDEVGLSVCSNTGHGCGIWITHAKKSALICVDEIIATGLLANGENVKPWNLIYWQKVKEEIQKL